MIEIPADNERIFMIYARSESILLSHKVIMEHFENTFSDLDKYFKRFKNEFDTYSVTKKTKENRYDEL